jgi:hypothetical protein
LVLSAKALGYLGWSLQWLAPASARELSHSKSSKSDALIISGDAKQVGSLSVIFDLGCYCSDFPRTLSIAARRCGVLV